MIADIDIVTVIIVQDLGKDGRWNLGMVDMAIMLLMLRRMGGMCIPRVKGQSVSASTASGDAGLVVKAIGIIVMVVTVVAIILRAAQRYGRRRWRKFYIVVTERCPL